MTTCHRKRAPIVANFVVFLKQKMALRFHAQLHRDDTCRFHRGNVLLLNVFLDFKGKIRWSNFPHKPISLTYVVTVELKYHRKTFVGLRGKNKVVEFPIQPYSDDMSLLDTKKSDDFFGL